MSPPIGVWERRGLPSDLPPYQCIFGKNVQVTLEPRPPYCDRGNWIAKVHSRDNELPRLLECYIDEADAFPRYYFDEARAKLEIEAWLKKRGQIP